MATLPKVMGVGYLPTGGTIDLYTVPANTTGVVKAFWCINGTGVSETVNIYIYTGAGSNYLLFASVLSSGDQVHFCEKDEVLPLNSSYVLRGTTTSTGCVSYYIAGVELT